MSDPHAAIEGLLQGAQPDDSIWHAAPLGMHSFSKPNGVNKGTDFIGVDYFTYYCGIFNFVTFEVQGALGAKGIGPKDFTLQRWQWYPSHLEGRWSAGGLEIEMKVLLAGPDDARLFFRLINRSQESFFGEVSVLGDENLDTMGDWGKYKLEGDFDLKEQGVLVRKKLTVGEYSDCFPWISPIQEKVPMYWKFYDHYLQAAVALGEGWSAGTALCQPHPERKRVVVTEHTGHLHLDDTAGLADRKRWKFTTGVTLAPGSEREFPIVLLLSWSGKKPLSPAEQWSLLKRAQAVKGDSTQLLEDARREWRRRLESVPGPKPELNEAAMRLYYKAWTAAFQNLMPAFYGGKRDYRTPVFSTNKVATGFQCPCMWESVIGSLLMGYVDVDLAAQSLSAIVDCIEEDGVLVEDCGYGRATSLPSILGHVALNLHRQGMDAKWLKSWYPRLRLNWRQQYRYPTWKRFGQPFCRNYFYAYHNGCALLEIARVLGRPKKEIEGIEERLRDLRLMVQAFWNQEKGYFHAQIYTQVPTSGAADFQFVEGTNGELLIGTYGDIMKPEQRDAYLAMLRDQMLYGPCMVANVPSRTAGVDTGTPGTNKHPDFAIKPSNYLYLWPAVRANDPSLFHTIVDRTLAGVAKANEFSENYTLHGECRHNQPMGFFGIFAVIWSILLDDRYAPEGLKGIHH